MANSKFANIDEDSTNVQKQNKMWKIPEQTDAVVHDNRKKLKENDSKSKMLSRAGLNFLPGSKLEAKDFSEKWYSARVVETDWIEREVLIHFDKWSSRFDEWIPMDSSRLRMLQVNNKEPKLKEFIVGERILATWADGKKYPAKVNAALGNDKYDVLFDDGYSKILRTSKMTKLLEMSINVNKFEEENTYIGSKQERRDKKRKHTVTELFHSHTKKKIKNENEKIYKKQDLTDLSDMKYVPNIEPTNSLIKIERESPTTDIYQNLECSDKLKKIKKEIFRYTTNSEHIVSKWIDKNSEESISGGLQDYATFIGNLRVKIEDSTYKCPKVNCNKNFRKENLLQMHIKHYHPEYSKFLGSTPNVADLAYARTIGESVEDLIPKKSRIGITQSVQTIHGMALSFSHKTDTNFHEAEIHNKLESKLSAENNISALEDNSSEQSNSCTMSPGTLFDMRFKEETYTGIKTLPPVRQPLVSQTNVNDLLQYSGILNNLQKSTPNDKGKVHKKKQHYSDSVDKVKKQKGISEFEESYHHFGGSLLDCDDTSYLNYKCNNANNNILETDNNENVSNKNESIVMVNGELIKVEKLRREEIINCTCGIIEEDGLMIQCDLCLCWQHGHCNGIEKEKDVPEKYVCYICQHAHRQRTSKMYFHNQDWIREGTLPSIYSYSIDILKLNERTATLKRSYDLIVGLLQIQDLLHSLRVKVNVAQNKDHPKLYLWAKNWSKVKLPTFNTEFVPIMEIIKVEKSNDNFHEGNIKEKLQFNFSTLNDSDQKLITSDTELMKILEEDSTQAEESKSTIKYSISNNFKDEGRILLDALTRNGIEDQVPSIRNEIYNYDSLIKKNLTSRYTASEKSNRLQVNSSQTEIKSFIVTRPVIPEPEAPIDPIECKLRLLEHIDHFQNYIDSLLSYIEAQLFMLEDMDINETQNNNQDTQNKQVIQMLLHDLESIRKMALLC